jgi:hypothetical protein
VRAASRRFEAAEKHHIGIEHAAQQLRAISSLTILARFVKGKASTALH